MLTIIIGITLICLSIFALIMSFYDRSKDKFMYLIEMESAGAALGGIIIGVIIILKGLNVI